MLRGRLIRTVLPVSASMLATVIESGRRPHGRRRRRRRAAPRCSGRRWRPRPRRRRTSSMMRSRWTATRWEPNSSAPATEKQSRPLTPDDGAAVLVGEGERLPDPPGVDDQEAPTRPPARSGRAAAAASTAVSETSQNANGVPDQPAATSGDHAGDDQHEPDPHRDPADVAVARDQLGGARQHQRHQHQRDRAAEADARGALTGVAPSGRPGGRSGQARRILDGAVSVLGEVSSVRVSITSHTRHTAYDAPYGIAPRSGSTG